MSNEAGSPRRSVLQAALADLASVPATSRWVRAGELALHVLDYGGTARPLVMLPGISNPAVTMDFIARELTDLVRPVIVDVRGRGLSDSADSYSLQDYVGDLVAVIDTLELSAPVVMGHSMGARIAALAASQGVGAMSGTVLVDPPMSSGPGRGPYPVPLTMFTSQLDQAAQGVTPDEVAQQWPTWPAHEHGIRARWLSSCDHEALRQTHAGFEADDFFAVWAAVPAPTVLMYGTHSPMVTARDIRDARAANPAARFIEVANAGHMVFWEAFDAGITALRDAVADMIGSR
ncbi:alpha/beta fold hydrolase [Pseudonocardia sulfidoxydans]|nr:alpha/beta hydrolase [Pseudonocardia sulfidoxydans]